MAHNYGLLSRDYEVFGVEWPVILGYLAFQELIAALTLLVVP